MSTESVSMTRSNVTVINHTKWNTRDLLGLCLAGIKAEGDQRHYNITVKLTRGGGAEYTTGYAYYHSGSITLRLPAPEALKREYLRESYFEDGDGPACLLFLPFGSVADLCHTLAHELLHTNGVTHREMGGCCRSHSKERQFIAYGDIDEAEALAIKCFPWAEAWLTDQRTIGCPVLWPKPKRKPAPVPVAEAKAQRLVKAEADLARWEKRLRLATTKVKKYRRRLSMMIAAQRRSAANTTPKEA